MVTKNVDCEGSFFIGHISSLVPPASTLEDIIFKRGDTRTQTEQDGTPSRNQFCSSTVTVPVPRFAVPPIVNVVPHGHSHIQRTISPSSGYCPSALPESKRSTLSRIELSYGANASDKPSSTPSRKNRTGVDVYKNGCLTMTACRDTGMFFGACSSQQWCPESVIDESFECCGIDYAGT